MKQGEDLRNVGAGDAFAAGEGGLLGDLAGVELVSPFEGLAERLSVTRRPGGPVRLRRPSLAARLRNRVDDGGGPHLARHTAHEEVP